MDLEPPIRKKSDKKPSDTMPSAMKTSDMTDIAPQRWKKTHFIAAVWLTWTAIAILSYARHYFEATHLGWPNGTWPDFLSLLIGCFYPPAILTPFVFRLEARFPLTRAQWKSRLGILFLASFVFSYAGLQIGILLSSIVSYAFGQPAHLSASLGHISRVEFYFEQFFFWSTLAAGCAIRHFVQFHHQARQATQLALEKSQLEASLGQAKLENLRMRLNPHFLFNTLQNISVLAQQNPKLASQMLTRLGDLLRAALRRNVSPETTVHEEMALTQDYLAVEKMRFGNRLSISMDVAVEAEQALLPTFLLQPLAENAVIHGLRGVSHAGVITLCATKEDERLLLTVADNGQGMSNLGMSDLSMSNPCMSDLSLSGPTMSNEKLSEHCKLGIGLSSTQERLQRMYPGQHEFVIRKLPAGGTEVRIAIPFRLRDLPSDGEALSGQFKAPTIKANLTEESTPSEQPATVDR
jgi:two-component system, LytTR family, sensor kinase